MACDYCRLVIGNIYTAEGTVFTECCGEGINITGEQEKYMEFDGAFHYFRTFHSQRCPRCGHRVNTVAIPCNDYKDGLFIKESIYEHLENHQ